MADPLQTLFDGFDREREKPDDGLEIRKLIKKMRSNYDVLEKLSEKLKKKDPKFYGMSEELKFALIEYFKSAIFEEIDELLDSIKEAENLLANLDYPYRLVRHLDGKFEWKTLKSGCKND